MKRQEHGKYYRPVRQENCLIFVYRGLDNTLRQTVIEMAPSPTSLQDRRSYWEFELQPGQQTWIDIAVHPVIGENTTKIDAPSDFSNCLRDRRERYAKWETKVTQFSSSHGIFDAVLDTAVSDFHALQISDGNEGIVAAGIP